MRFSFFPIEADDYTDCCNVFDEFDTKLSCGDLAGPHKLMVSGIDPSFDPGSLKRYAAVIGGSEAELEDFIKAWSHEWERHANMDY